MPWPVMLWLCSPLQALHSAVGCLFADVNVPVLDQ